MNHDAVWWGVMIALGLSAAVLVWLSYVLARNALTKKRGDE